MFLQNVYVEILTTNVMVLGGRDLRKRLGSGSFAFMNEISALIREVPEKSLAFSAM